MSLSSTWKKKLSHATTSVDHKDSSSRVASQQQRAWQVTKLLQQLEEFIQDRFIHDDDNVVVISSSDDDNNNNNNDDHGKDDDDVDQQDHPKKRNTTMTTTSRSGTPSSSLCHVHASLPKLDPTRVQTILESLLTTTTTNPMTTTVSNHTNNDSTTKEVEDEQEDIGQRSRLAWMAIPQLADTKGMVHRALELWLWAEGYYATSGTTTIPIHTIEWHLVVVQ